MNSDKLFKIFCLGVIGLWLFIFAIVPIVLVFVASILTPGTIKLVNLPLTFNNYIALIDGAYFKILLHSFLLAGGATILCLLIGYPCAFIIARINSHYKYLLLLLVIIPFWTSSLIRTYAIMTLLKAHGIVNSILLMLGIIDQPLQLLYSNLSLFIGLVYDFLPFMILPLYANIEKLDNRLIEAAHDLGAGKIYTFFTIILPLTFPGILAGVLLVFLPAMTMFYIPDILGGGKSMLLGNIIQNQFLLVANWPRGAAISIVLVVLLTIMLLVYRRFSKMDNMQDLA